MWVEKNCKAPANTFSSALCRQFVKFWFANSERLDVCSIRKIRALQVKVKKQLNEEIAKILTPCEFGKRTKANYTFPSKTEWTMSRCAIVHSTSMHIRTYGQMNVCFSMLMFAKLNKHSRYKTPVQLIRTKMNYNVGIQAIMISLHGRVGWDQYQYISNNILGWHYFTNW